MSAHDTPRFSVQMRALAPGLGKLSGMGTHPEPVIVADQGGLVVAEHGPLVVVIDRGNGPSQITAFVLAIVTLVFGGFGIVSLSYAAGSVSAVILAVGIASGTAMFVTIKRIRDTRRRPLSTFTPVAVFDRARRVYLDGAGQAIAPLDQVRFERRMQLTSSSQKLVAVTPSGTYVLKRGNPFGGGVGILDQVLHDAVHGR